MTSAGTPTFKASGSCAAHSNALLHSRAIARTQTSRIVRVNPCSEFRRDLSEFLISRALDNFFYTGHPKLTPLRVERFCNAVTDDRKNVLALESKRT